MNTQLAQTIADIIIEKWDAKTRPLSSQDLYAEASRRGQKIADGEMDEILDNFIKAALIDGLRYVDREGIRQHGAMSIASVNIPLLRQLEFD